MDLTVFLEVNGYESEQDRAKESTARGRLSTVERHGQFGRWALVVCKERREVGEVLIDSV